MHEIEFDVVSEFHCIEGLNVKSPRRFHWTLLSLFENTGVDPIEFPAKTHGAVFVQTIYPPDALVVAIVLGDAKSGDEFPLWRRTVFPVSFIPRTSFISQLSTNC